MPNILPPDFLNSLLNRGLSEQTPSIADGILDRPALFGQDTEGFFIDDLASDEEDEDYTYDEEEEDDPEEEVLTTPHPSEEIVYPSLETMREDRFNIYVTRNLTDGRYLFTFMGNNIAQLTEYEMTDENRLQHTFMYSRRIVSETPYNIAFFPSYQSYDWQKLTAPIFQDQIEEEHEEEDTTMPNQTRAADGPRTIRIKFSSIANKYRICVPPENSHDYACDYASSLEDAYTRARYYARELRRYDRQTWTVKPRRAGAEYNDLVNHINWASIGEDIFTEQHLQTLLNELITVVHASPNSEQTSIHISKYLRVVHHLKEFYDDQINSPLDAIKEHLIQHLAISTGVTFLPASYNEYTLFHPDTCVPVHLGESWQRDNVREDDIGYWDLSYATSHASLCAHCNQRFANSIMHSVISSGSRSRYCTSCYEQQGFYYCSLCQTPHSSSDTCRSYEGMDPAHIFSYSQDVRSIIPRMYHVPSDKQHNGTYLRYGVELEVVANSGVDNYKHNAAYAAGVALKHMAILKADSSIGSDGFEIVTVPATLEYHRKHLWNKFFGTDEKGNNVLTAGAKAPAQLVKSWSTNICGIHVHITRAALSKMQLGKLCVFYHEPQNNQFLSRIAGRAVNNEARYCKTSKKRLRSSTPRECESHHDAITISQRNKGKTAEVRIFRGNASRHGLIRCLEFVDATVNWCAQNGAKELTYVNFLQWFNQSSVRSIYPELWKHLIQLGYLTTKHKSKGKETLDFLPEIARQA